MTEQNVHLEHLAGNYKFIQMDVGGKTVLFGDPGYKYHEDLLHEFNWRRIEPVRATCLGGGRLDFEGNRVRVYERSAQYGSFDPDVVELLLRPFCEERGLELEVERRTR